MEDLFEVIHKVHTVLLKHYGYKSTYAKVMPIFDYLYFIHVLSF